MHGFRNVPFLSQQSVSQSLSYTHICMATYMFFGDAAQLTESRHFSLASGEKAAQSL
jgi:hypothetical protein